jgi:hypothetical protein
MRMKDESKRTEYAALIRRMEVTLKMVDEILAVTPCPLPLSLHRHLAPGVRSGYGRRDMSHSLESQP